MQVHAIPTNGAVKHNDTLPAETVVCVKQMLHHDGVGTPYHLRAGHRDPGPPSGGEVPRPCAEQQFRVQLMDSAPVEPLSTAFSISCYGCKSVKQTCKMTVRALNTKGSVQFRLCGEDWCEGSMVRLHVICSVQS